MTKNVSNIAHSVRDRLRAISRERNEDFELTLRRFAYERFLYRLQHSPHRDSFILKGGYLIALWMKEYYRATKDVDLLAYIPNTIEDVRRIFSELCDISVEPDGLFFDKDTIEVSVIQEDSEYDGIRINLNAMLDRTRIPLQFDLGFGDVVTPDAKLIEYPSLLDFPAPKVRIYSPQSFIAEKIEAMVSLGFGNSRMKDFYDVYAMSKIFDFDGVEMKAAIEATFKHRGTEVPDKLPVALTDDFANDEQKKIQWRNFIKKFTLIHAPNEFADLIAELRKFIVPILRSIIESAPFDYIWDKASFSWRKQGVRR